MFCKNCGNKIKDNHKFCKECGQPVVAEIFIKSFPGLNQKRNIIFKKIGEIFKKITPKMLVIFGLALCLIILSIAGFIFIKKGKSVAYTQNPTLKNTPIQSVVKIIVNKDTNREASGSGLLFTDDGYILTNAHVVLSDLGKKINNIKVCYSINNNQEIKCDYDAKIIDADRDYDLAVIKVDKKIQEIKPYYLKLQEEDEFWDKELVPLGSEIKAIGFPGIGDNSITITKGIISGYKNQEAFYNDGSLQKIPRFIKTDTEINYGNSGGAVFDKNNRYIGVPQSCVQDEMGKICYIIYWNQINFYLNQLVFEGLLNLPNKQFIKRKIPASEYNLWTGINAYNADDLINAQILLEKYTINNKNDSRAWNYLCEIYNSNKDYEKFSTCIRALQESNPAASSMAWYYKSIYNIDFEKDNNKAYDSINKAVNIASEFPVLLNKKAEIEINLGKYDEADKTVKKILEIDNSDSEGLMNAGILAEKNNDTDSAISYYEASFNSSPDSKSSSKLANFYNDKYVSTADSSDLSSALLYNVATLILDQKNIGDLISLAGNMTTLFVNDNESTWGESLNLMKNMLESMDIDKNLINSVGNVNDEEIKSYLKKMGTEQPTLSDIETIKYFIKTTKAWLYTFINDKTDCNIYFNDVNNLSLSTLLDSDMSLETKGNIVDRNILLSCICENTDYSADLISSCYKNKIKAL